MTQRRPTYNAGIGEGEKETAVAQTDRTTGLVGEAGVKVPVRAASTAALVLSGEQTVDGVALVTGDRVLVKDQASSIDNGIYVVDTGAWSRSKDCDGSYDLVQGSMVHVYGGTVNGNKIFRCTTANSSATNPYVLIGTASIVFAAMDIQLTGSSKVVWCGTATGTANALVLTPASAVAAADLQAGLTIVFKSGAAGNAAATTINVSATGALAAQNNGNAMVGGEIEASKWYRATLDGTALAYQVERIAAAVLLDMFTTKGDILAVTADGVVARKAAGTNGKMLVADSSQTDGLLYASKNIAPGGRLTLATATPVTTTDQAGKTTVYYTPYQHDTIELYDGAGWIPYQFAELSQLTTDATKSPLAVAANKNYDVFGWNDAGTLRATRGPTWDSGAVGGSDTARGTGAGSTELELFEGRLVNKNAITNGPAARRGLWLGTIRSDGSSQINDTRGAIGTAALRHVWNFYNQVERDMYVAEATDSWTYNSATVRALNNSSTNRVNFVLGQPAVVTADAVCTVGQSSGGNAGVGIALDVTNASHAAMMSNMAGISSTVTQVAKYKAAVGIGAHFLQMVESGGAATTTFQGDGSIPGTLQTGMMGTIWN